MQITRSFWMKLPYLLKSLPDIQYAILCGYHEGMDYHGENACDSASLRWARTEIPTKDRYSRPSQSFHPGMLGGISIASSILESLIYTMCFGNSLLSGDCSRGNHVDSYYNWFYMLWPPLWKHSW